MGCIRFLLALSVLITHSTPLSGLMLLNGDMAVICFFMVSGFLMAMVLEAKYAGHTGVFFANRLLRIYPPYLAALILAAVVFWLFPNRHHNPYKDIAHLWSSESYGLLAAAAVSNLTLFGAELSRYLNYTSAGEVLLPNFLHRGQGSGGHNLLFVPQAWTLPLELMFYALAPFAVRLRTRWLAVLTLALALAYAASWTKLRRMNVPFEPAAFFPLQLQYFLGGVLAYRALAPMERLVRSGRLRHAPVVSFALAVVLIAFSYPVLRKLGLSEQYLYPLFAACLPGVFLFARDFAADATIGEFSYPIYLFHYPVAKTLSNAVPQASEGWLTLVLTLLISAAYIWVVDRRVQSLRSRMLGSAAGQETRTAGPQT